jgi:UDP-N-acetylmuramoyl-tripeptide--D-alanyl-D-alanine ligase
MKLTLTQIAEWIGADGGFDASAEATGYSIDSRTIRPGELFFAVRGENTDGHNFAEAALTNGAVAAVVSADWNASPSLHPKKLLRVPEKTADPVLAAMQRLAHEVRHRWGGRIIGVTGSAGKTTTKECVATVLASRFRVLKSEGNLNNHFGVPLQLLRLEREHELAVLEMGMNHAGEIRALAAIAEPDWGVVSNVAPVHLEFFADGIDGIARAKYELIESLPASGLAVLNADDSRVAAFARGRGEHAILYGTSPQAEMRAVELEELGLAGTRFTAQARGGQSTLHLRLPGRHNVLNALAAIACGLASGIDLRSCCAALETMRPSPKRGQSVEWRGATLIDDTYNSNPRALDSMVAALHGTPATRRIVIAGEMLELGPEGPALHRGCGEAMAGIDAVIGVRGLAQHLVEGARSRGVSAIFVETPEAAADWLCAELRPGDVVLLKASRGVRLERALERLREHA